jgi:uncharacterized protein (TIGR00369 family)
MKKNLVLPEEFEPEFVKDLKELFEVKISFNQILGIKITELKPAGVKAVVKMEPKLVGHFSYNRIHGGVISACLDSMGGLACMAAIGARHMNETPARRIERFSKLATIDLRVDYLRPGIASHFEIGAEVLRLGSRVASTRMQCLGPDGKLFSTGAAAYIIS